MLASTFVGGLITAIEKISILKKAIFDIFGSAPLLLIQDNLQILVGVCIAISIGAFCLWIHLKMISRPQVLSRRKRYTRAVILWGGGLALGAVCTSYALPSMPDVEAKLQAEMVSFEKELLALKAPTGGVRYNRVDSSVDAQAWSTAQIVWALLQKPAREINQEQAQVIRAYLEYMERIRLPGDEGWGYMEQINWGVTEIAAWVTLAYVASTQKEIASKVWPGEIDIPCERIETYLALIKQRQMENGGYSPVKSSASSSYQRTYSTLMSVWAMIEAQRLPGLKERLAGRFSPEIESGIRWLLATYHRDRESAVPNPNRAQNSDSFPGLTAQVLYVLERSKPEYGFVLRNTANHELMLHNFIKAFESPTVKGMVALVVRDAASNDRTHDSDRYLTKSPYMVESSTYLWLPWSLALCAALEKEKLNASHSRSAVTGCKLLAGRTGDLISFAKEDPFVYVMAESLFALHLHVNKGREGRMPARQQDSE